MGNSAVDYKTLDLLLLLYDYYTQFLIDNKKSSDMKLMSGIARLIKLVPTNKKRNVVFDTIDIIMYDFIIY